MKPEEFFSDHSRIEKAFQAKDWSKSVLGDRDGWSALLNNALNMAINSPRPVLLLWGEDKICFYNEAYLQSCGFDFTPEDFGEPASFLFGSRWTSAFPQIDEVYRRRKQLVIQDKQSVPLMKDFSLYAPYNLVPWLDNRGQVEGVLLNFILVNDKGKLFEKIEDVRRELDVAIDAADLGTWEYDPNRDFLIVNEKIRDWFGVTGTNIPLEHALLCIVEKDRARVSAEINKHLRYENRGIYREEYDVENPFTKQMRRVLAKGKAVFDENRRPIKMKGTLQDITKVTTALAKNELIEQRLNLALQSSNLAFFEIFPGTDKIFYSNRLLEIFHLEDNGRLTHDDFKKKVYRPDIPVIMERLRESFRSGNYEYEARIIVSENEVTWIKTRGKVHFNEQGVPSRIIGTVEDISDQKRQEQILHDNEFKLNSVLETAPFPIVIYEGENMTITYANKEVIDLWGKGDHILGKTFREVLPELNDFEFFDFLQHVYRTGKPHEEKSREVILNRHGSFETFYFDYNYTPLLNPCGKVYGVLNTAFDVTESVTATNRLKESEARFKLLANSLPQLVWAADKNGNLDYWNQATYRYCGVTDADLQWGKWIDIIHPNDRDETVRHWEQAVKTGETFITEHRFLTAHGSYRWQLSRALPFRNDRNNISRWLGSSTDIQDIKEQETQKDFFISMASHELKTPVTSAKAYTQILMQKYAESGDVFLVGSLGKINNQINKLTGLINDLLDLTKIKTGYLSLNMETIVFADVVEECINEVRQQQDHHQILWSNKLGKVQILADKERLGQAILNLILNAIKYSPQKTEVVVKTELLHDEVLFSVQDRGIGIAKQDQQKIFERFYRVGGANEKTYPGFGIGLYIVKDIIVRHGGFVGVESEPGKGSNFYFTLPAGQNEQPED